MAHPSDIDWQSVGTLTLAFFAAVGTATGWIVKRLDRNRSLTQRFVTEQVQNVAEILEVKLTMISDDVKAQGAKVDDTRDRVLRMEGKINGLT